LSAIPLARRCAGGGRPRTEPAGLQANLACRSSIRENRKIQRRSRSSDPVGVAYGCAFLYEKSLHSSPRGGAAHETDNALNAFAATDASAQAVGTQSWLPNLSGVYRCVNRCTGAGIVRVVQRGRQLTLVDPGGQLSSAWIEAPGHIWTAWKEGAVYSPDGFTIQFAGGTVWVLLEPTPIPGSVE
jgi:hypothetical protein